MPTFDELLKGSATPNKDGSLSKEEVAEDAC